MSGMTSTGAESGEEALLTRGKLRTAKDVEEIRRVCAPEVKGRGCFKKKEGRKGMKGGLGLAEDTG